MASYHEHNKIGKGDKIGRQTETQVHLLSCAFAAKNKNKWKVGCLPILSSPGPKPFSPKPKTKGPWADTKILWATT